MNSTKSFVTAVLVAAVLTVARGASAAGSLPLPAAPPAGAAVASTLRDALTAIEQAAATNPAAAQNAAFFYNAAIEQYRAHEYAAARASALTAISRSAAPTAPNAFAAHAPIVRPAFPGPDYFIIPDELPATPANAQRYVALARNSMARCRAPQAEVDYRGALRALGAKQYRVAMAAARDIVDDCSGQ